jgi:hypothetical protein
MQPCVKCGWDTRSGSRICAACRVAEATPGSARAADPDAEKEALLTAVLRSARSVEPVVDDDEIAAPERLTGAAGTAGNLEEHHVAVLATDPGDEDEHVALREIRPSEDDFVARHDEGAVASAAEMTAERGEHDQPDVATSLVEALDDSEHTIHRAGLPPPPVAGDSETNGMVSGEIGQDTADDLAALFNAPSPWDRDPRPANRLPAPTQDQPDSGYDPAAFHHATGDIPAGADPAQEPAGSWDTGGKDATYSAAEWPWVGKSGDGGFWAPPADHSETAVRGHSGTWAEAPEVGTQDDSAYYTAVEAAATSQEPSAPEPQRPEAKAGAGERLRAAFQELGAWTAVAQVALLAVGMLCIIQVFVLIVVNSYLGDARSGGDVETGSLAAHAKVDGVMLPALLACALVAFAFAAWRSAVSRSEGSARSGGILGSPLGVPIALWRVLLAAITLLLVIIAGTPPTVAAALRITQWAIFACALLGTACFAAPRGLEAPVKAKDDGVSRQESGGASGGGIPPRAGSRSTA